MRLAVLSTSAASGMCWALWVIALYGRASSPLSPMMKSCPEHPWFPSILQLIYYKFPCCWALRWSPAKDSYCQILCSVTEITGWGANLGLR